jgi:hypothetical protein
MRVSFLLLLITRSFIVRLVNTRPAKPTRRPQCTTGIHQTHYIVACAVEHRAYIQAKDRRERSILPKGTEMHRRLELMFAGMMKCIMRLGQTHSVYVIEEMDYDAYAPRNAVESERPSSRAEAPATRR